MNRLLTSSAAALALALAGCGADHAGSAGSTAQAAKASSDKITTPVISSATQTQVSIDLDVLAPTPGTGLPAGFSIQWMSPTQVVANGGSYPGNIVWSDSDAASLCKASFSGNASESRYDLEAGGEVTVRIGDVLLDNGASVSGTGCDQPLTCGTTYVFRAFGHAATPLKRSDFTGDLVATTAACPEEGGCTFTQGYWKTHGPVPTGNNEYVWPQGVKDDGLKLGSVTYTAAQLVAIFDTTVAGNGLVSLAHQLIAAKLNVANGASSAAISTSIADADALIGNLAVPPVGSGSLAPSATGALTTALTDFNEGTTGPGHCE